MSTPRKLLVVGAHSADFVWRAAGAIAVTSSNGGTAKVIALSYGERGESGQLWKEPDQTVENVKRIRHEQAEKAANILGADFQCLDLGDYPLEVTNDDLGALTNIIRSFAPNAILTHTERDPFNPDHPVANHAVRKARTLAAGAGVPSAFPTVKPAQLFIFEPHQPELCGFTPNTFLDITGVFEVKLRAMQTMKAQEYLQEYYSELAARRANHARRASGNVEVRYAEAFQRQVPQVVDAL